MQEYQPEYKPVPRPNFLSTGLPDLDRVLGGGYQTASGPSEIIGNSIGVARLTERVIAANATIPCFVGATDDSSGDRSGRPPGPWSCLITAPTPAAILKILRPRLRFFLLVIVWVGMTYDEVLDFGLCHEQLRELHHVAVEHKSALIFVGLGSVHPFCRSTVRVLADPLDPNTARVRASWTNGYHLNLRGFVPR